MGAAQVIRAGGIRIAAHPRRGEGRWHVGELQAAAEREQMLKLLCEADRGDAVGAALAFLLHAADRDPDVLRRVLRAHVEREGRRGCEVIDVLNGAAGKA